MPDAPHSDLFFSATNRSPKIRRFTRLRKKPEFHRRIESFSGAESGTEFAHCAEVCASNSQKWNEENVAKSIEVKR